MPVPQTLTEALDNLYTTTWHITKSSFTDQIFDATPFWFMLRDKGQLESKEGGKFILEPLRYAKSERVKFIGKGGTTQLSDQEFLSNALYEWKYLTDTIVRFGVDDQQNRGKQAIMSLLNAKLDTSRISLEDKMESSLLAATADVLGWNTLPLMIPTTPAAPVTFGGIDPSTDTWWQNQATSMAGVSFAVQGHSKMRKVLNDCGQNKGSDFPDLLLTNQTDFERYEDSLEERHRIPSSKMADAGFDSVMFKSKPLVWSPTAPAQRIYFLALKYVKFMYDPIYFFDMTAWKEIPDQVNDRAAQIVTAGNLITNRRRTLGVLHTIDTD